ncbi:MAG: cytochrome c biogenesis protein CcsA [Planctomycetota bacterium]|nr:cytochrome c biogenesis protein CcsA [Planctomycetota bacterium]
MAQLGHLALLLAFIVSSCAITADILGKWRGSAGLIRSGRDATIASFACLTVAVTILLIALVGSDFSIAYVAQHTSNALATSYKISALWAGAAGSLLLWLWMQAGFVVIVFGKCKGDQRAFCANARVVANLVCVFFLLVLTFRMNLFAVSEVAISDGAGLDLRLQHLVTALHPPILFIGYAACVVPFAWSFAWLKWDTAQGPAPLYKQIRNWILPAWLFLTIGAVLGAWLAYEQLGSEGHWLQDVAQNVSVMPWLPATALLYCSRIHKRDAAVAEWIVVLSLITFTSCVLATFPGRPDMPAGARKLFIILLIHIWVLAAISSWRRYRRSTQGDPEQPDKAEKASNGDSK